MIRALDKAESLDRIRRTMGCQPNDLELAITAEEGMELLTWYAEQYGENVAFQEDFIEAQLSGDPFPMLSNFQLYGFAITRTPVLN